jgi:hypothetical protein
MHFFSPDVEDTYRTVILKELSAFKWVIDSYNGYNGTSKLKWVIKMDDDVILNPWATRNFLRKQDPDKKAIYGRRFQGSPFRHPYHKWYYSIN